MTVPPPPGPNDGAGEEWPLFPARGHRPRGAPLTPHEDARLHRIAEELAASDPELVVHLNGRDRGVLGWWPVSKRSTAALVAGLVLLAVVAHVLPSSDWAALAAVTALVVLPWMAHAALPRPPCHARDDPSGSDSGPTRPQRRS